MIGRDIARLGVVTVALFLAQDCFAQQTVPGMVVVTAFGARGNGVADDTKAIQAAENAIELLPGCGSLVFPPGNYVINSGPVVIKKGGCRWRGEGGISQLEGPPYFGVTLLTDVAGQDIVFATSTGSGELVQGPAFENLNFVARSNIRSQNLLHVSNVMQGHIFHCSFRNGAAGVYFEGSADDSNWAIDGSFLFDNNTVGVDHAISSTGGGNNVIAHGYIVARQPGDIGIRWQSGNAQGRVIGIHFTSSYPASLPAAGVSTLANQVVVAFNDFEGYAPAVVIPEPIGSNDGRGTRIIGNSVIGNCTNPAPAWNISPKLGNPVVISLNTYQCVNPETDGQ